MKDQHVYYGEPVPLITDESFLVRAVTHDEDGLPLGVNAYVLLCDEDTGYTWRLNIKVARRLSNAIRSASNAI